MKFSIFERYDFLLLIPVILLTCIGIFFIYSSGINSSGVCVSNEYIKQIVFASIGLILMLIVPFFDYKQVKRFSRYFYYALLLSLLYVMFFGHYVNGARSWVGVGSIGIQPSEFGKIFFMLYLASFLEKSDKMPELKRFIFAGLILAIPVGMILLQPDMGTASVYFPIFLIMCFLAGIPLRYLAMTVSFLCLTLLFTVLPIIQTDFMKNPVPFLMIFTNTKMRLVLIFSFLIICILGILGSNFFKNKYYYWIAYVSAIFAFSLIASIAGGKFLKDSQIKRLIVFINPQIDPLGAGWNIIQSKIAIGSGNFFGQGFLKGTQSHLRFLPQQSTDFIFSILSEEMGFLGSLIVAGLYFIILIRCLFILKNTTDVYGYYIAAGIMFMFFYHFVVNVGMVMGIMPITGIPLLFLSYGGSSLWTSMICIGLLMNINYRRLDFTHL